MLIFANLRRSVPFVTIALPWVQFSMRLFGGLCYRSATLTDCIRRFGGSFLTVPHSPAAMKNLFTKDQSSSSDSTRSPSLVHVLPS